MSDKNIFRNFAYNFYNEDLVKNDNNLNRKLKKILKNLEINSWDEFDNFIEIGMDKWLKRKVNDIKEKTKNDIESISKNIDREQEKLLENRLDIESKLIEQWKADMKEMQFYE